MFTERYFRSRATLVCFAFARPRPIWVDPLACHRGIAAVGPITVVRHRLPEATGQCQSTPLT